MAHMAHCFQVLFPSIVSKCWYDLSWQVDDKGKTTTLTKEQVVRGKRLFIATCASCHVGGGTRTNQNVGLAIEELSGATPNRASIEGLVDYLNNPTTYDGLKAMCFFCQSALQGSRVGLWSL